jgi:dienelactone hydrolase
MLGTLGALALPWEQLIAQTTPTSSLNAVATPPAAAVPGASGSTATLPPDLANLHAVIDPIAHSRALRHSFLDPQWRELEAWKNAARPLFHSLLSYDPTPVPLRAELVRREDRDGFTLEVLRVSATASYHLPMRVLVPKGRSGRLPAVVALHAHGGRYPWGHHTVLSSPDDSPELTAKVKETYGRPWAEALARRGFIVAVIDAFYFGERRLRVEDLEPSRVITEAREAVQLAKSSRVDTPEWHRGVNRACSLYESLTAKNLFAAGATWPGLHTWDDRRTVDYLLSRPDVAPDRIGAAGLSIGGLRTAHLIAADPRIKVAAITGWMTQFTAQHRNHLRNHTWMIYVPGLYRSMDFPDVAGLHAPGALLVQQCSQDQLYPLAAMHGAVEHLQKLYAKAGIPERFRGTFYDEPHVFRPHMQDEVFAWFERWL